MHRSGFQKWLREKLIEIDALSQESVDRIGSIVRHKPLAHYRLASMISVFPFLGAASLWFTNTKCSVFLHC